MAKVLPPGIDGKELDWENPSRKTPSGTNRTRQRGFLYIRLPREVCPPSVERRSFGGRVLVYSSLELSRN